MSTTTSFRTSSGLPPTKPIIPSEGSCLPHGQKVPRYRSSTTPASTSLSPRSAPQECTPVTTPRHATWPGAATISPRNWYGTIPTASAASPASHCPTSTAPSKSSGTPSTSSALMVWCCLATLSASPSATPGSCHCSTSCNAGRPWCSSTPTRRPPPPLTPLACL